jgi:hypothetical protein
VSYIFFYFYHWHPFVCNIIIFQSSQ